MKTKSPLVLILLILISFVAISQTKSNRTITGTVLDENGETIIGASVLVKGTTVGTATDIDGKFSLSISSHHSVFIVSFVGMETQEVSLIDNKTDYRIVLKEDAKTLDEVVVVGYGTMKKMSVIGSVSSVTSAAAQKDKKAGTTWKRSGMADNSIRLEVGDDDFLLLEAAQMAVQIDGFRVRVLLDCFFFNNRRGGLEGTFQLKLPAGATPYYFAFGETKYINSEKGSKSKVMPYSEYSSENFNLTYEGIKQMDTRNWNNVKEARIVSKNKAAEAYTRTVARKVDPALMEWRGADMFSCRVFPLAMNTLHRVVVGYDLDMTEALDFREYILTLPKVEKEMKLDISMYQSATLPAEITPEIAPAEQKGDRVYYSLTDPKRKEYKIHYNSIEPILLVQNGDNDEDVYFANNQRISLPEEKQEDLPADAVFLLDVSLSSNPDKFNVWLKLIEETLHNNRDIIKRFTVLCFNIDHLWYKEHYSKNNYYNVDQFLKYANTLALEGATDIASAIKEGTKPSWLKNNEAKHVFLMSDADCNWGETNKHAIGMLVNKGDRVHTYKTGLPGTLTSLLDYLSSSTGGFSFTVTGEEEAVLTSKSFRYKPWNIENIEIEGVKDFLITGKPIQLYNGQKLIFTGRGVPTGNIKIAVNNGRERRNLEFTTNDKTNSVLASRIYGQTALSYLGDYGKEAEDASVNYSTFFKIPSQFASLLMLESEADYRRFGITDSDSRDYIEDNLIADIIKELEAKNAGALLANGKANFLKWLDELQGQSSVVDFSPEKEFMEYVNKIPENVFQVEIKPLKYRVLLAEQQTEDERELLSNDEFSFMDVLRLAQKRKSGIGKSDGLKLLSSVIERNAADLHGMEDIATTITDWGMGDHAYYMMRRIIDWRQGESTAYKIAARSLAKSGNIDMAIIYFYIYLNSSWDKGNGGDDYLFALEFLKFINDIEAQDNQQINSDTKSFLSQIRPRMQNVVKTQLPDIDEADILIVLNWNLDDAIIDIHVLEPTGEEAYYGNSRTKIRSIVKDPFRYGSEIYVVKNAVPGKYQVMLRYYSSSGRKTVDRATGYLDIYRNWGRKDEKHIHKSMLLETVEEKKTVLNIKVK